jgi:hypothetical protein
VIGFRPACESAGAKRSARMTHQSTLSRVRAASPAAKSAAAAPSMAPLARQLPHAAHRGGARRRGVASPLRRDQRVAPSWRAGDELSNLVSRDSRADGGRTASRVLLQ